MIRGAPFWDHWAGADFKRGAAWRSQNRSRSDILSYRGRPENGPPFCEAAAFWRWSNCVHSRVPAAKKRLLVNMDETSVRLHQSPSEGHLVHSAVVQSSFRNLWFMTSPAGRFVAP
jgi:hypothetical protein